MSSKLVGHAGSALATLVLVLAAAPAPAQMGGGGGTRLSLRPQLGFYIPTENLVEATQTGEVGKMEAGPSFGAAIGLRFGSHFGIEVAGAYVPTTFTLNSAGNNVDKHDAKLFLGNGLVVVDLLPATSMLRVFVNAGVGVISHGGVAFTDKAKTTDLGGVAGAGVGIRLGGLQLIAGTDLYRYSASFEEGTQTSSKLTQTDFALKVGLGFGVGR
jgi:hypothetical protein